MKKIIAALFLGTCTLFCNVSAAPDQRPNIVFILADDLGWADLPDYGNKFNEAPNLTKLAREGTRFTNAYASAPVCSPSRGAILSGQYPPRVGITEFISGFWRPYEKVLAPVNKTQYLPLEQITFAEQLKQAGYVNGYFGKWHLGDRDYGPEKQGFDTTYVAGGGAYFFPKAKISGLPKVKDGTYMTDLLTDLTLKFIEEKRDKPFFAFLSFTAVHIPLEVKKELADKYRKKSGMPGYVNNPEYAALLENMDTNIGRIMQKLDELHMDHNTIVIFYSDNGGLTKSNLNSKQIVTNNLPLRDEKGTVYEGGIRVPMIVKWAGKVPAGRVSTERVSGTDLYPTFLALADAKNNPAQKLDGVSLKDLLLNKKPLKERPLFWHYPHYHHMVPTSAMIEGDYKLIEKLDDTTLELYNITKDPGEQMPITTMPGKRKEMHTKLVAWRKSLHADMPRPNPDFDAAKRSEIDNSKMPGLVSTGEKEN
jgi:uncharacterized sulfatase